MIIQTLDGDITDPSNTRDIIIAMNTELGQLSALGRRFISNTVPNSLLRLGSILTFDFDDNEERKLHMIVCHNLCENGWRSAPSYLRYGLDTLWAQQGEREYSIVQVGAGKVGFKYGANACALQRAMQDSFLELTLFIRPRSAEVLKETHGAPLRFLSGHSPLPVELAGAH